MLKSQIHIPNTFLYFAYGSNMFKFRCRMECPSAEFVSVARLDNYRLDFIKYSKLWGGPTATLVTTANAHVWGVIWRVHNDEMGALEMQEGVNVKKYYVKYIEVLTQYMGYFQCRTYIQKENPLPRGDNDEIPIENWPSKTYKDILILGAIQHKLPEGYIHYIKNLKDNGEEGCFYMVCLLRLYTNRISPCKCISESPLYKTKKLMKLDMNKLRESRNNDQEYISK